MTKTYSKILTEFQPVIKLDQPCGACWYGGGATVLQEWLAPSSIVYLCECLQVCESAEMVADLRRLAPAEALREATKPLSARKRQQIKAWVQQLNLAREVAV